MSKNHCLKLFSLLIVVIFFSGCAQKSDTTSLKYKYENKDLGVSFMLPIEFRFFESRRVDKQDIVDIEIFVPTKDSGFKPMAIPGYANPVTLRVYTDKAFKTVGKVEKAEFKKILNKNSKIYSMKFWESQPDDWKNSWSESMERNIITSFQLN